MASQLPLAPMLSKDSVYKHFRTRQLLPCLLFFLLLAVWLRVFGKVFNYDLLFLNRNISCVRVEGYQTREGIGALVMRNQIAFFLADRFNAKISYPNVKSDHAYEVEKFFSTCPPTPAECRIEQDELFLNRCPMGDCDCRFSLLQPYLSKIPSHCRVITFKNDRVRSLEYCGCYRDVLRRYFGGPKLWPRPYDAIHYRQGDLTNTTGKVFGKTQLAHLMNAMCKLSDRDIIVVTEGEPEVPACGNRVVLAGNTTMMEAVHLMQHAEHIAFGFSSFAIMMADIANPQRMFMASANFGFLRWVKAPNYTIVGREGQLFHFDDYDIMQRAYNFDLEKRTSVAYGGVDFKMNMAIPARRWETELARKL